MNCNKPTKLKLAGSGIDNNKIFNAFIQNNNMMFVALDGTTALNQHFNGSVSCGGNVDVTGDVSAVNVISGTVTASGDLAAANITASGDLAAANITASGAVNTVDVNATNVNATTVISGTVTASGDLAAANITASGAVNTVDVNATNVTASGDLAAANITASVAVNTVSVNTVDVNASGDLAAANITANGFVSCGGDVSAVNVISGTVTASGDLTAANITAYGAVNTVDVNATNVNATGVVTVTGVATFNNNVTLAPITINNETYDGTTSLQQTLYTLQKSSTDANLTLQDKTNELTTHVNKLQTDQDSFYANSGLDIVKMQEIQTMFTFLANSESGVIQKLITRLRNIECVLDECFDFKSTNGTDVNMLLEEIITVPSTVTGTDTAEESKPIENTPIDLLP
jgi:hypothetical protein